MSNFRLLAPDCVLIHVPKTGGTSIRKGVWQKRYEGPVFGAIPDSWRGLFTFAFVRHPLDRFVSAWRMFTCGTANEPDWRMPADARPLSIEEFGEIVFDDGIIFDERRSTFEERIRHHTIPQTHPFNCLDEAEFVGRFERLEADFAHVARRVGAAETLPHMHGTGHGGWRDHVTGDLLAACRRFYDEDLRRLGYSVDD
jgi:hypothetical protein